MEKGFQPTAGMLVAGYRLERRLGEGGMSEVWAAVDIEQECTVALKVLLPQAQANVEIVMRFRREAELLGRIDSDYVPRLHAFLENPEGSILVEEFIEGELLAERLEKRRLGLEEAIDLGTGLARALVELHRAGIVHRDLKPGNVILRPKADGGQRTVLIDLGVSRMSLQSQREDTDVLTRITDVQRAVGTIPYMAPEQFVPGSNVTEAVDLYALGAILFRAVAGHHVFAGLQQLDVAHAKLVGDAQRLEIHRDGEVARAFEGLVACLLHRDPEQRYRSADELLADLLMLGQGIVPRAKPPTTPSLLRSIPIDLSSLSRIEDTPTVARRSPRALAAFALLASAAAGAIVERQWFAPIAHAETPASPVVAGKLPEANQGPQLCLPPLDDKPAQVRAQPSRPRRRQSEPIVQFGDADVQAILLP